MKIIAFTTAHWHDEDHAKSQREHLEQWESVTRKLFNPNHLFIACGTYSNPEFCPVDVAVVNSGIKYTKPYDIFYWHYAACAFTAGFAFALQSYSDWDFLVCYDHDTILGNVDLNALAKEFIERTEVLMSPAWCQSPDGSLSFWKPDAAAMFLHMRKRANLIEKKEGVPEPILVEHEWREIYEGRWWNPWPDIKGIRQEHGIVSEPVADTDAMAWPMVRLPSPEIRHHFSTLNPAPVV